MKPFRLQHPYSSLLVLLPLLTACQTPDTGLPGPVSYPRSPAVQDKVLMNGPQGPTQTQISRIPETPTRRTGAAKETSANAAAAASTPQSTEPISIAIDQTPLPTFIQIMYGNVLKLPYTLDPAVLTRTEPVTFKTSQPLPWDRVKQLAETLLQSYNLVVTDFDGLVRIAPAGSQQVSSSIPVLRSAETSSLPDERRPVFHYIELQVVRTADMAQWLRLMLGTRVTLQEDANRNAFMLSGNASDVRSALDLIQAMDQPRLRGRAARRFAPANIGTVELANRLTEVLTAQGYSVAATATGAAAVLVLPVPSISSVIVFAHNDEVMGQVQRWVLELDRPGLNSASNSPLFTYAVRFADAQELARTLNELLGGTVTPAAPATAGSTTTAAPRVSGGRVVVNNATNTLIIRGSGQDEQQQIRQLLRELDRPTKSAMIEVVVAELSVGALESLGVDWSYLDPMTSSSSRSVKIGSGGLSISYANSAKKVIAAISALTNDNKGRVLSNPKIMARNGETATIAVGRDVPVLTGQQTTLSGSSPIGGSVGTGVLQTIQYRNTGVNLRVRPVINSGNRLDLEVTQEVSSVAQGETGVGSNPIISNRKIDTKLSLRDGSTVLLGGLISRDSSTTDGGVPLLKDIPLIGAAFRKRTDSTAQTELLVMITPYVINDDFEAEEITAALHKTFGDWASDIKTSRVVVTPPKPVTDEAASVGTQLPTPPSPASQTLPSLAPAEPLPTQVSEPAAASAPSSSTKTSPANNTPARPEDLGVQLSRPGATPTPPPAPAGTPAAPRPQAAVPEKPASAASEPGKGMVNTPAGPGRPVTDPKEREELLKAIQRGR